MSTVKRRLKAPYLNPGTVALLAELGEECQRVLKLLAQLEIVGLKETQVEALVGEFGAAILHLHEHTRDLDTILDEDPGAREGIVGIQHIPSYRLSEEVRMTLATTTTLYTPEDLLTLPDYGRFELLGGHLVERKMGATSSYVATNVLGLMWHFVRNNSLGLVFQADCGYQCFSEDANRVRFADVSFIRRGKLPEDHPPQGHCRVVPDLVIEAVSPNDTAYEIEEKIAQWLDAGVHLVWVLYPDTRHVQVHRLDGTVTKLQPGDQLLGEDVVPGFQCQVAEVFQGL